MIGKKRLIEFVFIVLLVLVLSAFRTVTARADDATPPPTATPVVTLPADDGSTGGTDVAPTDTATQVPTDATVTQAAPTDTSTPLPTDATVTQAAPADTSTPTDTSTATPVPTQASGDAGPTATDASAPLVSQIPQGNDLPLVSDNQPAVPAEAEDILAVGDPIWCPTGVTPKANTGGCTAPFTYFDGTGGLLEALAGKATNGTIWIESAYGDSHDSSGVTLSDATTGGIGTSTIVKYALTMQGGWTGSSKTISGSSTFTNIPLTINWNSDVILNNITVTGVSSGTALDVTTPKNITLTSVNVNANTGAAGAVLDNCLLKSIKCTGTGNVTVKSSQFNGNTAGDGLYVQSNGTISLSSVTADGNSGYGADLENYNASSAKNVTLTSGPYEFNGNGGTGLNILSKGAIALKDIDALGNTSGDGAYLDNTFATGAQGITLTGSNVFSGNVSSISSGLEASSTGPITANNLVANANGYWGAVLDNTYSKTAQGVTLTGSSNQFNSNQFGLTIHSLGNITLNSVTANYNSGDPGTGMPYLASGAALDNCQYSTKCTGTGKLTLTGTNTFEDNDRSGLVAWSGGTITISNLLADGNGHDSVTPGGEGAFLSNAWATTPRSVTLTGTNSFSNNYNDGLDVQSLGAIAVSNITADTNTIGNGVNLSNFYTGAAGSEIVNGMNTFDSNGSDGLDAYSRGAILLSNLDAEGNTGYGAWIDNSYALTPQIVTLNGINLFNSNHLDGLDVISHGTVYLNNIGASGNSGAGAFINNTFNLTHPQNVTVSGTNTLNNNGDSGLAVVTYGTIAVNNITADNNGLNAGAYGWGAYLDNCGFSGSSCLPALVKSITLTGINTFNGNYQDGLWATSLGAIKGNSVNARGNRLDGAYLNNQWGKGSNGGITLTGNNSFLNNLGNDGLEAYSNGAISLNNLTANNNTGDGVRLATHSLTTTGQNVTLSGSNIFLGNGADGLEVYADGNITVNHVLATGNHSIGTVLDNCLLSGTCKGSGTITLTGLNTFSNNLSDGLDFTSHKTVTLNSVTANKNSGIGVNGITDTSITVLGGSMTSNVSYGWQFYANTTVTLKGVFAIDNNGGVETHLLHGTLHIVRTYP
ncbi:MAG: hypothetical protein ABSB41_03755 [Anaerolineales bacterium]